MSSETGTLEGHWVQKNREMSGSLYSRQSRNASRWSPTWRMYYEILCMSILTTRWLTRLPARLMHNGVVHCIPLTGCPGRGVLDSDILIRYRHLQLTFTRQAAQPIPAKHRSKPKVQCVYVPSNRILRTVQVLLQPILPPSCSITVYSRPKDR